MMGILLNVLAVVFLGWPALVVGYLVAAIKNGYLVGVHIYGKHEDEALHKFVYRVKVPLTPKEPT